MGQPWPLTTGHVAVQRPTVDDAQLCECVGRALMGRQNPIAPPGTDESVPRWIERAQKMRHREQDRLQLSQEQDPMSSMSSSATTSITPHSIQVPSEIVRKWQEVVDVLAEIMHVPSASIMRREPPHIKAFVSSTSKGHPYEPGALA